MRWSVLFQFQVELVIVFMIMRSSIVGQFCKYFTFGLCVLQISFHFEASGAESGASGFCNGTKPILELISAAGKAPASFGPWNGLDYDVVIYFLDSVPGKMDGDCIQAWKNRMRKEFRDKLSISGLSFSATSNKNASANSDIDAHASLLEISQIIIRNQRPLIMMFVYLDDSKLSSLLEVIKQAEASSTSIHEIELLFVPATVFSTKLLAFEGTKSALQLLGQYFTPARAAYLYAFHYTNNSLAIATSPRPLEANRVSILVQESYSIRGTMIARTVFADLSTTAGQRDGLGILSLPHEMFPANLLRRRLDFEGAVVIASGHEDHEYNHSTKFKENSEEFESGFEVSVYRYLRDALNFTEKSIKANGYIRPEPNGSLAGYANQLSGGLADIGTGMTEFLPYRLQGPDAISMLMPMTKTIQSAFFKQPPPSSVRNIFVKTFTVSVWSSLFVIWVFIIGSMKLITFVHRALYIYYEKDERVERDVFMWATGAVCQQGWHTTPESICVKIVFFCGSLTGLILYIAYSAALVSILSVNVNPVTQFADLITYGFDVVDDYRIPTANATLSSMVQNHEFPKTSYKGSVHIDQKINNMLHSRYAIVTPPDSFYPIASLNYSAIFVCTNFDSVRVSRSTLKMSPCVKKGSPLRMYFNYVMLLMKERGILSRLFEVYLKESCVQCLEKSTVYHANLNLGDVFTAFVVLLLGYVLSGVLALIEVLYFRVMTAKILRI